jgi:hypothetical protein
MFAKLFKFLATASMVASVMATPVPSFVSTDLAVRGSFSFNNYHGDQSMSNFDSFYGSDNFSGEISKTIVVKQKEEVVCHSESITIIQQRLVVLQEMAKRIITEQVCDVESQTVVFEQFYSSLGSFGSDLRRQSGRSVGYDSSIASHFGSIVSSSGSLSTSNFGFSGSSVGSNYVVPGGSNWNDQTSPASVGSAYSAAQAAISSD